MFRLILTLCFLSHFVAGGPLQDALLRIGEQKITNKNLSIFFQHYFRI